MVDPLATASNFTIAPHADAGATRFIVPARCATRFTFFHFLMSHFEVRLDLHGLSPLLAGPRMVRLSIGLSGTTILASVKRAAIS